MKCKGCTAIVICTGIPAHGMHMYTFLFIQGCIYNYIYTYTSNIYMHSYIRAYVCSICAYRDTCIYVCIVYVYAHIYICIYICSVQPICSKKVVRHVGTVWKLARQAHGCLLAELSGPRSTGPSDLKDLPTFKGFTGLRQI